MKSFKRMLAAFLVLGVSLSIVYAATYSYQRYVVSGIQIYEMRADGTIVHAGPLKKGDNNTGASVTLPTTVTGPQFGFWVPVFNNGAAVTAGDVLISSGIVGGVAYVKAQPGVTSTTTVVGVAAEAIAASAKGWMVPMGGGYAVVKTTGAVAIGDCLVSSGSVTGRAGATATPTSGAQIGVAMSAGAAAGDTVLAIMR